MPGYFLFAPPPSDSPEKESAFNLRTPPTPSSPEQPDDVASFKEQLHDLAGQEKSRKSKEARRARLAREREEAYQGELAWVRSGGRVRDAKGRVDRARTELLRAEIRLQDEEKRILDAWNAYEARWRALSSSPNSVAWSDLPWPVYHTVNAIHDLSSDAIREFIFKSLGVRGNTVTKKDRLRTSLLRWHPDKAAAALARVPIDHHDRVLEGINFVFITLKEMQDTEKLAS